MTVYDYAVLRFKLEKLKPQTEVKFHPLRKWRFDFCFPEKMLALEIEGAVYSSGRHTRGSGFIKDIDKYNNAAILEWKVFRAATTQQVDEVVKHIKSIL